MLAFRRNDEKYFKRFEQQMKLTKAQYDRDINIRNKKNEFYQLKENEASRDIMAILKKTYDELVKKHEQDDSEFHEEEKVPD